MVDRRSLTLVISSTIVAAVLPAFLTGVVQVGAVCGIVTAALSSAATFFFLSRALGQGMQKALLAMVLGFLSKMVLVTVGVLATRAVGGDLLAFAVAFFGLFLVHQMIEISAVLRSARKDEVGSNA